MYVYKNIYIGITINYYYYYQGIKDDVQTSSLPVPAAVCLSIK